MKRLLLPLALLALLLTRAAAADGVPVFQRGLEAFQANGADALLGTWYTTGDDADKIAKLRDRLAKLTARLGPVVDTQVFKPYNLGKHVQRLYGVIYFEKRPLWLRAEYYEIGGRSGFLSLDFSLNADDILPLAWAPPTG